MFPLYLYFYNSDTKPINIIINYEIDIPIGYKKTKTKKYSETKLADATKITVFLFWGSGNNFTHFTTDINNLFKNFLTYEPLIPSYNKFSSVKLSPVKNNIIMMTIDNNNYQKFNNMLFNLNQTLKIIINKMQLPFVTYINSNPKNITVDIYDENSILVDSKILDTSTNKEIHQIIIYDLLNFKVNKISFDDLFNNFLNYKPVIPSYNQSLSIKLLQNNTQNQIIDNINYKEFNNVLFVSNNPLKINIDMMDLPFVTNFYNSNDNISKVQIYNKKILIDNLDALSNKNTKNANQIIIYNPLNLTIKNIIISDDFYQNIINLPIATSQNYVSQVAASQNAASQNYVSQVVASQAPASKVAASQNAASQNAASNAASKAALQNAASQAAASQAAMLIFNQNSNFKPKLPPYITLDELYNDSLSDVLEIYEGNSKLLYNKFFKAEQERLKIIIDGMVLPFVTYYHNHNYFWYTKDIVGFGDLEIIDKKNNKIQKFSTPSVSWQKYAYQIIIYNPLRTEVKKIHIHDIFKDTSNFEKFENTNDNCDCNFLSKNNFTFVLIITIILLIILLNLSKYKNIFPKISKKF